MRLYENSYQVNAIDPALYAQHDVKRGPRNATARACSRATNISNVHGYVMSDGEKMRLAEASFAPGGYDLTTFWATGPDAPLRFRKRWPICCSWGELPTQERLNRRGSDRIPSASCPTGSRPARLWWTPHPTS